MNVNLKDFLLETEYCDFNDISIKNLANKITKDCDSSKEKAIRLFYWVRDNIPYKFCLWNKSASDVLEQGYGMCTNKSVLLTALLRASDLPAGFGVLKVRGKDYFGPIAPKTLKRRVGSHSVHIYSYVFLDGQWFKIDSSVDKNLSEKTNYFNPTTELTDWDGKSDAKENLDPEHILSDNGPIANIDDKLKKKPRNASKVLLNMGNYYLDFLRQNQVKIFDVDRQLDLLFKNWLKKNHFMYYLIYITYFNFKN